MDFVIVSVIKFIFGMALTSLRTLTAHWYAYCAGNPVNFIDCTGLSFTKMLDITGKGLLKEEPLGLIGGGGGANMPLFGEISTESDIDKSLLIAAGATTAAADGLLPVGDIVAIIACMCRNNAAALHIIFLNRYYNAVGPEVHRGGFLHYHPTRNHTGYESIHIWYLFP